MRTSGRRDALLVESVTLALEILVATALFCAMQTILAGGKANAVIVSLTRLGDSKAMEGGGGDGRNKESLSKLHSS